MLRLKQHKYNNQVYIVPAQVGGMGLDPSLCPYRSLCCCSRLHQKSHASQDYYQWRGEYCYDDVSAMR